MNNPISVNCPQNTWTKIATGVKNLCLWKSDKSPASYLYTYRITGDSAPSSRLEGQPLFIDNYFERIQSAYSLDVYIFAVGDNGQIRVDEFLFYPNVDDSSKSAIYIDYNHHKIHAGEHFFYSRFHIVASGATINFAFEAGAKSVHFVYAIDSDFAGFTYSSYKDVTYTAGTGTPLDIRNNNSIFADNLTTSKLILNPTGISIVGAATYRTASKGTATNPAKSSGGSLVRDDEVIFKPNTKWLLAITNKATADNPINVGMSWYENGI